MPENPPSAHVIIRSANLNTCRGSRISLLPRLQSRGAEETWQEAVTAPEALVAIDLFCGAGGLSYGFQEAGFICALGIDQDADSCETHAANLFSKTRCLDIQTILHPVGPKYWNALFSPGLQSALNRLASLNFALL